MKWPTSALQRSGMVALLVTAMAVPTVTLAQSITTENGKKSPHSMALQKSMMDSMKEMESMPMTGDVDHDFVMMMRKHHQSALDMAQVELQHGKDPKIKSMAQKIITSQKKEIAQFDRWLAAHKMK